MKTYFQIYDERYIPIRDVAIKFCYKTTHFLKGNEIKKQNVSIDRKINNIKHENT